MLRLYVDAFWISPYSFSAFVALQEKALPFAPSEIALQSGAQKQGDYPRQSLTGRIPCLVDGDFWLPESSAIAEYLDDKYPAPQHARLLPPSLEDRARARMVMAFIRSDLLALREERPTHTMFYEKATKPLTDKGQAAAAKLLAFAGALIPAGKTSLFGPWTLADSDLAFMLQRLGLNGHPLPKNVANFIEAQWARPSVQAFLGRKRPPYTDY